MMGCNMRILHISDLHLEEPMGIDVENVIERFYAIIAANAKEKPFSQIVITGDIRNSKNEISVDSAIEVINKIAASANVSNKQQIHFVPGNHDLNRGSSKKLEGIRNRYDYINGTFHEAKSELPIMLDRFNSFFWKLCDKYYNDVNPWNDRIRNPHYLKIHGDYAFIFINSSLGCINRSQDGNLIIGTAYLKQLVDSAVEQNASIVIFFAHHPIQNLENLEETALDHLLSKYTNVTFFWMCGDAHGNRHSLRGYIRLYQVGCLTKRKEAIPDFAIYDICGTSVDRKVFRYLEHLNNPARAGKPPGGWKRVYIDPRAPGLHYDETLD